MGEDRDFGRIDVACGVVPADMRRKFDQRADGRVGGGTALDDAADAAPFEIHVVLVVDLVCGEDALDWKETFLRILELRPHVDAVVHQGPEVGEGDLWACVEYESVRYDAFNETTDRHTHPSSARSRGSRS